MIERKIYRFSCQHCRQERVSDMPVGPVCFGDGDSELATAAELIANGWRERRCQVCDRPTWIQLGARRYAWRAPADPITGAGLRPGAITPQGGRSHAASPHLSGSKPRAILIAISVRVPHASAAFLTMSGRQTIPNPRQESE
jgi:hypothetical protein